MRRTALIAGFVVSTPGLVLADAESINGTLSGNASATDNAFSAASGNKSPDMFLQIRPGLLFGYETPRAVYTGFTEAEALDYVAHYKEVSVTVRVGARAAFVVTPLTDIAFTLDASTGKLNALQGRSTPDQTTTTLVPAGAGDIYQVAAGESAAHTIAPSLHIGEGLGASFVETFAGGGALGRSAQASGTTSITKSYEADAFSLQVGVGYVRFLQYNPGNPDTGVPTTGRLDRQFTPNASLSWRHDISRKWSGSLSGGVAAIVPVGTDPYDLTRTYQKVYAPTIGAQLSYVDTWGFANLAYGHAITPNLLIAQNTISDSGALNVNIPLAFVESRGQPPRYAVSGSLGYVHQQLVDTTTSAAQGSFSGEHFDLGVVFNRRPGQVFGLRYAFQHQGADAAALIPVPAVTSNTISFTFALRYPARVLVPQPKRQSVRADESDLQSPNDKPPEPDPGMGGNANPKSDE